MAANNCRALRRLRDVPGWREVRQRVHRAEDARDGFSGQKAEDEFKADLLRVLSDCTAQERDAVEAEAEAEGEGDDTAPPQVH